MQQAYELENSWMQEDTEAEIRNYTGSFCGFVLLNEDKFDLRALEKQLNVQWNIVSAFSDVDVMTSEDIFQDLMFDLPGALATVSLIQEPIPEEEGKLAAERANWSGAFYAVQTHCAHLMIAVLPADMSAIEAASYYCKILSSALKVSDHAIAVYTSGTILDPVQFQQDTMQMIESQRVALENLFYIGTYVREDRICAYTIGLDAFGKDELELLDSSESKEQVVLLLQQCICKLLEEDHTNGWYFTITLDGDVWEGRRKDGVMVEGHSIQLNKILK